MGLNPDLYNFLKRQREEYSINGRNYVVRYMTINDLPEIEGIIASRPTLDEYAAKIISNLNAYFDHLGSDIASSSIVCEEDGVLDGFIFSTLGSGTDWEGLKYQVSHLSCTMKKPNRNYYENAFGITNERMFNFHCNQNELRKIYAIYHTIRSDFRPMKINCHYSHLSEAGHWQVEDLETIDTGLVSRGEHSEFINGLFFNTKTYKYPVIVKRVTVKSQFRV